MTKDWGNKIYAVSITISKGFHMGVWEDHHKTGQVNNHLLFAGERIFWLPMGEIRPGGKYAGIN